MEAATNNLISKNPEFKALIDEKLKGQHFMKHIGFELTKKEAGHIEGEAIVQPFMAQQDGFIHGGVTATLADIVTGFAAFSLVDKNDRVVTADLKISYFNPGKGVLVYAIGKVVKPGSRLHYCEAEVFCRDENGKDTLIAKAYAIMAVLSGQNK